METWLGVAGIIAVATVTPGPNNFIVLNAAARGGWLIALPLIAGVVGGGAILFAIVWMGAGMLFEAEPTLRTGLTIAGSAYLVWLGIRTIVESMHPPVATESAASESVPHSAPGVLAFQLVNPKAWVLTMTATAAIGPGDWSRFAVLVLIFAVLSGLSLAAWTIAGSMARKLLDNGPARQWFDRAMGALLICSAGILVL